MKIIVIGDIHGLNTWQDIISKENNFDKVIFIGDYWDSFNISYEKQRNNFLNILEFKRKNPDKVILLFGNHDYHYLMMDFGERYSGFQKAYCYIIRDELIKGIRENIFKMCHIENDFLFSHAGITNTWLKNNGYDFR